MPSPNFDARPAGCPIDMLVIHYTGMRSAEAALARLGDAEAGVSAHYVIDEDGSVIGLVEEGRRAWHAGRGWWRGEEDINARSVGVELVNPGHEFGYRPFPEAQMSALENLAQGILARHPIARRNVVGHADVAPRRKRDPGELFDWRRLAGAGIGLWPEAAVPATVDPDSLPALLSEIGYETKDLSATTTAFQRRFRPARFDGVADAETARLAAAVAALCT
ncbi:MAG: N-acetylmuramoyl-L-alanine amidase [Rhodospirillales bacterium]|nr:N-acetylmuramoyl-L-alanine amidase [Rhodospirillales bacterium]